MGLPTCLGSDRAGFSTSLLETTTSAGVLGEVALAATSTALHSASATTGVVTTTTAVVGVAAAVGIRTRTTFLDVDLLCADSMRVCCDCRGIASRISKFDKSAVLR